MISGLDSARPTTWGKSGKKFCTGGFLVQSHFQRNLKSLSCFASRNSATNQRSRMMWTTASRFTVGVGPWENAQKTDVLLIF